MGHSVALRGHLGAAERPSYPKTRSARQVNVRHPQPLNAHPPLQARGVDLPEAWSCTILLKKTVLPQRVCPVRQAVNTLATWARASGNQPGVFRRHWRTELAKHVLPKFASPGNVPVSRTSCSTARAPNPDIYPHPRPRPNTPDEHKEAISTESNMSCHQLRPVREHL